MERNYFKLISFIMLGVAISFVSCNKDDEDENPTPGLEEYVANDDSFKNFGTWTLGAELQGVDPALGGAHGGNDASVVRSIYFKDNAKPVDGEYPVGTVIVKHSHNDAGTVEMYTAMVKRGNNFDSENGDWEYFMLSGDGAIATDGDGNLMRGDGPTMMGGMCLSCHAKAVSGNDYIFTTR